MRDTTSAVQSRRLLAGLLVALAAWGIYLAIGATGWFADAGLFDQRRSWFVLGCSTTFIGLWLLFLRRAFVRKRGRLATSDPGGGPSLESTAPGRALNWPSCLSLAVTVLAWCCWAAAWFAWLTPDLQPWNAPLGWLSVAAFGLAAILALVGLSDPVRDAGKLAGLLTLLLLAAAAVALVVQLQRYKSHRELPPPPPSRAEPISGLVDPIAS